MDIVDTAAPPQAGVLFADAFDDPATLTGPRAQWRLRPAGERLPGGDGVISAGPAGLVVVPTGTDPDSGWPAFAPADGALGDADHLRWAAFAAARSSAGFPGFDARGTLAVTATVGARGYGLHRHPYGSQDIDPRDDLRLGAAVLICVDGESGLVFDFIVTDGLLFAVYERLALPGTSHAAFSYAVPVTSRAPEDLHTLSIRYDAAARAARWLVDGSEVLAVDRLGRRVLDPSYLRRDNGLAERALPDGAPRQLSCGLGLFTDRIWGQGVRLEARRFEVRRNHSRKDLDT